MSTTLTLTLTQLAKHFPDAELRTDYDGEPYVSIPVGYMEAVEVEGSLFGPYVATVRRWDRTGGIAAEEEIGDATTAAAIRTIVTEWIENYTIAQNALEDALDQWEGDE